MNCFTHNGNRECWDWLWPLWATGTWNLDMARSARETLTNYRDLSYYLRYG